MRTVPQGVSRSHALCSIPIIFRCSLLPTHFTDWKTEAQKRERMGKWQGRCQTHVPNTPNCGVTLSPSCHCLFMVTSFQKGRVRLQGRKVRGSPGADRGGSCSPAPWPVIPRAQCRPQRLSWPSLSLRLPIRPSPQRAGPRIFHFLPLLYPSGTDSMRQVSQSHRSREEEMRKKLPYALRP